MKLKTIVLGAFSVLLLSASCHENSNQLVPISREEYEAAFKQCAQYNFIPDTMAVDSAVRYRLQRLLTTTYGKDSDWVRYAWAGRNDGGCQYEMVFAGPTGELHNMVVDSAFHVVWADSASRGSLPLEYHAYSRKGLYAGEWWCEDAGNPPLDIRIWKAEDGRFKRFAQLRDSTLCFPHAWNFHGIDDIRQLMFWGDDNTLYLKCHRLIAPKNKKITYKGWWKHSKEPLYYKVRVEEQNDFKEWNKR